MRPDTIFHWIDESNIVKNIVSIPVAPLYMQVFSSDKGPEEFVEVQGENFYKLFGSDISFERHGQPLVQAAHIIDNGGKILCKRVVAPDATLANISVIAKVAKEQIQKTNDAGDLLYTDKVTGQETTTADGNDPIMINTAKLTYDVYSVPDCQTINDVKLEVEKLYNVGKSECAYPLFTVVDNGRGESNKRIYISTDRDVSKGLPIQLYYFNVAGNNSYETEYTRFTVNPDTIYINNSMCLSMTSKRELQQVKVSAFETYAEEFLEKVAEISGLETSYLNQIDVLFGTDKKGNSIPQIHYAVEDDTFDIGDTLGIQLLSGENGSFGNRPFGTEDYNNEIIKVFNGTFNEDIFDANRYTFDAIFDANYDITVKAAITTLADWRQDFFFFRDIGIQYTTYTDILDAISELPASTFAANYITSYEVIDPYGKKQIPVTLMYDMAIAMISHFNERRFAPCCGIRYGFTFPNAIEGTVNFCPKYTPSVDQKTKFCDDCINYCTYINGVLTLETEYTSQDPYSHLSFINNILGTQEVIHAVRKTCPNNRYAFITSNDLNEYKTDVENVLKEYREYFNTIEFVYTADEIMQANKIFQASIKVSYKNFVQTEIFKIYALASA